MHFPLITQGLEADLEDQLQIEYSPTYWLSNNTVLPTTTQRTTSTSTQSVHTSIFSTSMKSNAVEKITEKYKDDGSHGDDDDDDDDAEKHSAASALQTVSFSCLLILSLLKFSF